MNKGVKAALTKVIRSDFKLCLEDSNHFYLWPRPLSSPLMLIGYVEELICFCIWFSAVEFFMHKFVKILWLKSMKRFYIKPIWKSVLWTFKELFLVVLCWFFGYYKFIDQVFLIHYIIDDYFNCFNFKSLKKDTFFSQTIVNINLSFLMPFFHNIALDFLYKLDY